jgi:hypothetical protein
MDETFEMLVMAQCNIARRKGVGGIEVGEHILHKHPDVMMLDDSALTGTFSDVGSARASPAGAAAVGAV